ncbi:MAG TPA: DUF1553 domain-containing protein, partial [Verrucomicrobiae bacterium]|nr:DUF1553 domain-containing protein [Verrucomicrobiae bacterium]
RIRRLEAESGRLYAESWAKLIKDKAKRAAFQSWRNESLGFLNRWPNGWATPAPEVVLKTKDTNAVAATNFSVAADGWVSLNGEPKNGMKFELPLPGMRVSAIRLEVVADPEPGEKENPATKWKSASVRLSAALKPKSGGDGPKLSFEHGEADYKEERYSNGHALIGVTDEWLLSKSHERQAAVWLLDKPLEANPGDTLVVDLGKIKVASVRLSLSPFASPDPLNAGIGTPLHKALSRSLLPPNRAERDLLARTYLLSSRWDEEILGRLRKLQGDIRACRGGKSPVTVTVAREPMLMRVLRRGNWQDEGGEVVQPLVPHFLPQIPNPSGRRLTRLDLAKWLVSRDNPLTARAVMNRLWKQFFGVGISAVVDDLGAQGEWPVHPELLDWLAAEFMEPSVAQTQTGGMRPAYPWDLKHMVRLLVTSAAYRQDSNERPELKEIDPNNQLVAYQSPRRLEAEFIRDNALAIAGLLDPDIGGPSSFPYQPAGYYAYLQFPDRDYHADRDERQYRRGVYTHWQRTFLHPMLANFDAPSREECTANR